MLTSKLIGRRVAEVPRDAQTPGHQLLVRGGYIRQVGAGIYTLLPLAKRAIAKVETIIREEMNRIGGQEITMPVVVPASLWIESGRYEAVDSTLVRFRDRTDQDMVLNMTHEEVVVDAARSNAESYRQFPFMLYQIQTKFRDEPRSRAGLIRVREFTMKDAYSFHRTQEDLAEYYMECHKAYTRIFQRCGLKNFVDIESDTGMMGGRIAHEFMLVSPMGEDTLFLCGNCDYRANREVACTKRSYTNDEPLEELREVETPNQKTIEEVTGFLNTTPLHACKTVAFMEDKPEGRAVLAFIRGDLEVNMPKLSRACGIGALRPMEEHEFAAIGSVAGFVGPIGIDRNKCIMIFDESIAHSPNLVIGANRRDYHRTGFNFRRDLGDVEYTDIAMVDEGDVCPECSAPLRMERGIEIGNIFQLGTKYTEKMEFTYNEEDGSSRYPIMGCYGIGVGRTMQCIVEESHDDYGPLWPVAVAPFTVQICCIQAKDEAVLSLARKIYEELLSRNIDVIFDDREVRPGFMFADADLIGAPIRVTVSPRNLKNGIVEMKYRVKEVPAGLPDSAPIDEAVATVLKAMEALKG
jgi:prolyl-tRNA synthetase